MTNDARRVLAGAALCAAGLFAQGISPPHGLAEDPVCPTGTYWNPEIGQCLPAGVNPVIGPAGPIGVGGVLGPVGPGPVGPR